MCFSHVQLFVTPWTVAHQASLSVGFSRQESWSGLPFPPPAHLPDPGIEPTFLASAGRLLITEAPGKLMPFYRDILLSLEAISFLPLP